ncbi:hypothetical protein BCR32DRAFT_282583 [Anaeromyces robustus]|uniref:Uncharacterized protein n=1 Tax=Anaeromyces robustus TaxID=1754192 RepID=A0A1Y1WXF3_9FUNG|nr:hypothetical protein BCR32DRAFT_282583 [Anaeromyces robustus]|eukprot:ORX78122.1 hypothetical protein BCR32DRAFT_282583 [Anaeromyces robustus]
MYSIFISVYQENPKKIFRIYNYSEGTVRAHVTCNSDSECFFNKCIDNYCVFNEESRIEHCDIIYKYFAVFEFSHIHCGKTYSQSCSNDNECSSERCRKGLCSSFVKVPNDTASFARNLEKKIISRGTRFTGSYLELDNVSTTTYMFANSDCTKVYLCKRYKSKSFISGGLVSTWNALEDLYFRSELINYEFEDLAEKLEEVSILNTKKVFGEEYNSYFYKEKTIPTLGVANGSIVILTRPDYVYKGSNNNNIRIGLKLDIPDMGDCKYYGTIANTGEECYPVVVGNYSFQDNYNLDEEDKWKLVQEMLDHKIPSRSDKTTESNGNYKKKITVYGINDPITNKFYDTANKDVFTIIFMNVALSKLEIGNSAYVIVQRFCRETIQYISEKTKYINNNLSDYIDEEKPTFHNEWFILYFPTNDLTHKIYENNNNLEIKACLQYLVKTNYKCLYVMNSQNARMVEFSKADDQINYYIHFKIVDNKYICIKNNVDPTDHCFIIQNNPDLVDTNYNPKKTFLPSTTITSDIKPNSSNCYFEYLGRPCLTPISTVKSTSDGYIKTGYPCCSSGNTVVVFVDFRMENGV